MWMPVICMHAHRVELERIRGQRRSCSQGKPPRQNKPQGRKMVSKCARPFLPCFRTCCFVLQCRRGSSGAAVWGAARLCTVCNPPCFLFPDVCLSHVLQSIWPAAREHRLMVEIRIETYLCLSRSPSSCFFPCLLLFFLYFFSPSKLSCSVFSDFSHSLPHSASRTYFTSSETLLALCFDKKTRWATGRCHTHTHTHAQCTHTIYGNSLICSLVIVVQTYRGT